MDLQERDASYHRRLAVISTIVVIAVGVLVVAGQRYIRRGNPVMVGWQGEMELLPELTIEPEVVQQRAARTRPGTKAAQARAEAARGRRDERPQGHATPETERIVTIEDMAPEWAKRAAEAGDPAGCNNLAVLHLKGFGDEQSFDEAIRWYQRAAEGDHAPAQNMLGTLYLSGQGGLATSAELAEKWWRRAAEQGYAPARYNLGGMYWRGLSKTMTREDAILWLSRAAEQGHRAAARELAELEDGTPIEEPAEGEASVAPPAG